jgi:hypothetical protein
MVPEERGKERFSQGEIPMKKFIGVLSAAFIGLLALAGTASADVVTVPLEDFLLFAGHDGSAGQDSLQIQGANLLYGNVGSNGQVTLGASDTHILGSVYAGVDVDMAQFTAIGSNGNISHIDLEENVLNAVTSEGYPTVDGSGFPTFPSQPERVIANDGAILNNESRIYGTLDANTASLNSNATVGGLTYLPPATPTTPPAAYDQSGATIGAGADTFALITMPTPTDFTGFINNGAVAPADNNAGTELVLNSNTLATGYGALTTAQNQIVTLTESGDYYFQSINTSGGLTMRIDLTNGPVNIYVVGEVITGQDSVLWVTNATIATHPDATNGYLPISHPDAQALAAQIYWESTGKFYMRGGDGGNNPMSTIFGGTFYSTFSGGGVGEYSIEMRQHLDWFGALWAAERMYIADHSRYTFVPLDGEVPIPEPATMLLFGTGLAGVAGAARRKKKNQA